MYKMKLITMKTKNGDCGVCAFAMVAGITYEESLKFLHDNVFLDDRKTPLVWKKEMQKALDLFPITYDYFRSKEKWENLTGTLCLLHCRAPGFFRHWIVYEPSTNKIYDPTGKRLEKSKYTALRLYFSIGENKFKIAVDNFFQNTRST